METPAFRRETACSFSGHRPGRLPGGYAAWHTPSSPLRFWIRKALEEAYTDGYRDFVCGMALGADTLAAEEVLAMRERRPAVRLIAALPCPGQEARWPLADKERYRTLLAQAGLCVTACPAYTPYAMHARNRWMVEHTSRLIAWMRYAFDHRCMGQPELLQREWERHLGRADDSYSALPGWFDD